MKILHINTLQNAGAAWCAMRLSGTLAQHGVESKMLFAEGNSLPAGIDGAIAERDHCFWERNFFLTRCKHLYNRLPWVMDADKLSIMLKKALNPPSNGLYLHIPLSFYTNICHHPLIEWADVIHLHWVAGFLDYPSFFKKINKPIVWTLHDKYPIAGLQHYNSKFFPVPEHLNEIDSLCRSIKRNGCQQASDMCIVAISESMMAACETSEIFKDIPCTLIHNGVDTNIFTPKDKQKSRADLWMEYDIKGISPEEATVFLFSSVRIWDENKGLQRVIDALANISCNKILVVVGNNSTDIEPHASFPIICTGLVTDQQELSKIYSSADYFLQASFEETFSQTPLEAMSCGVPVITTPVSGASDLVRSFNGVICSGYSTKEIEEGIDEALSNGYDAETIRSHIVNEFSIDNIATKYLKLYESMLP